MVESMRVDLRWVSLGTFVCFLCLGVRRFARLEQRTHRSSKGC